MDYLNFHKHCDRVFRRFLEFYFILHKDASVASDLMGEKLFRSALVLSVSLWIKLRTIIYNNNVI